MTRARLLTTLLLTATITALPASPAHAAGSFVIDADIATNGGATATLSDTLVPSNRYLLTLTATGGGTCGLPGATVQIVDNDIEGFANPVSAATSGACTLYDAAVAYTITWYGDPGVSGQFPILCTWTKGTQQCSPTTVSIVAP